MSVAFPLAVSTLGCPDWTLEQAAEAAASYGYRALEIRLLDADVIYAYLTSIYNEEVTLLCWEKPDQFCHRNLVAKWFKDQLDIDITELGQDEVV